MGAMHILVTGFEPFGNDDFNASGAVVSALPPCVAGRQLTAALLPVSFARSGQALASLLAEHQPDALLCLGEAGGRAAITPEARAVNLVEARIADNDGNQPHAVPVAQGGPQSLHPSIDAWRMAQVLADAGFAAEVSADAGRFVCNHLAYQTYAQPIPALFIHVPALRPSGAAPGVGRETDPSAPSAPAAHWDLARLGAAVELAVASL